MAFWSTGKTSPTRQYAFAVEGPGSEQMWWVKTATKPAIEITTSEYQLINHIYKMPTTSRWNDVTITMVDTGGVVKKLLSYLRTMGYTDPTACTSGISKPSSGFDFRIKQYLEKTGNVVEEWTLKNAFISSIDFGQLDYSSDELVEITLVITYDYAKLDSFNSTTTTSTAKSSAAKEVKDNTPLDTVAATDDGVLSNVPGFQGIGSGPDQQPDSFPKTAAEQRKVQAEVNETGRADDTSGNPDYQDGEAFEHLAGKQSGDDGASAAVLEKRAQAESEALARLVEELELEAEEGVGDY